MVKRQLGRYEIIERLGRGGMAEVFRARQSSLDREVAVKLMHAFLADDPMFRERFEREARNVAKLKHPNIVQVYDFEFDHESESYYMVMELINGKTLKDRLTELGDARMMLSEVLHIMDGALAALSYAHSRGMIHRDLKAANLMIEDDGRVVMTDFGIAKIVTSSQYTASGGMVGTPAYMAPEQGLGEQGDERTDIYSMGVILFQLATGKLPFDAESPLAVILQHLNSPVPDPRDIVPSLPTSLRDVSMRAMAKDPGGRFQTADEMRAALDQVRQELSQSRALYTNTATDSTSTPTVPPPYELIAAERARRAALQSAAEITPTNAIGKTGKLTLPDAGKTATSNSTTTPKVAQMAAQKVANKPQANQSGGLAGWIALAALIALLAVGGALTAQTGRIPILGIVINPSSTATITRTATVAATALVVVPSPTAGNTATLEQVATTSVTTDAPTEAATVFATAAVIVPPSDTALPATTIIPTTIIPTTAIPTATKTSRPSVTPSFTTTPSATSTQTHTATYTASPTDTPSATRTPLPSFTRTPSPTFTPSRTITPSPNFTETFGAATATSFVQTFVAFSATQRANQTPTIDYTGTATVCNYSYQLVSPVQPDSGDQSTLNNFIRPSTDFERDIVLRNLSDCDWLPGMALVYISGERLNVPARVVMQNDRRVLPGETGTFSFIGRTGTTRGILTATWRLVTDGGKEIRPPLELGFFVYRG